MFLHHLVTIVLMLFAWVYNYHRFGSLIMIIHDPADIFLEFTKSLKYANFSKAPIITFSIFAIVWIITRLMIYPRILFVIFFVAILPPSSVLIFFKSLLLILFILHIYWTYFVYKILYDVVTKGNAEKDARSSSEETDVDAEHLQENDKLKS